MSGEPTEYTCTVHKWTRTLGFNASAEDFGPYSTVTFSAEHVLEQLAVEHFADGLAPAPKHIAVSDIASITQSTAPPRCGRAPSSA